MAMALILTNIQIGAFAVINEAKNRDVIEQSINEGTSVSKVRQEKPTIEILNDSGRSIKANSENFNLLKDTSLKVKIDTKQIPTVLTLKLPYYYKFADNIKENEKYTILSVDDAIPADKDSSSEITRNLIKIEVPAGSSESEKGLSIVLPIQLNKKALINSVKKDKVNQKENSDSKKSQDSKNKNITGSKVVSKSSNESAGESKDLSKNVEVISPKSKNVESVSGKADTSSQSTENISLKSKKSDSESQSESISKKLKNVESVSEKEKTDSKSTESVKKDDSNLTSSENISAKFSKKSVKTEDMSKPDNIADNASETSFILISEQSQAFIESGEDSTITIPWINPNSIKIDENDLEEDNSTEETNLSQVEGSLEKDSTEISTNIKHLTGLVDNKDVADLVEENINDTNDTETDTTSKETVSSGSHSSKDKTGSKIDSTSDTEKDKNTESDKKTDTDKKSEEDKNKEPDKKTDKTEEQNNKKEDGKEEQGKTAEENKDSTNTNVVTNPIDDNVLGKAEEPGKENEIPILKPENQPLAQIEPEAEKMLDKLTETGINPLQPNMMAAESSSGHPDTLTMEITNINGVAPVDFNKFNLRDYEALTLKYTFAAQVGRKEDTTLTIRLPDFYSFNENTVTGDQGECNIISIDSITTTNPNAKRNSMTIIMPANKTTSKADATDVSFTVNLNKDSITPDMVKKWAEGTWTPNSEGQTKNFTIMANGLRTEGNIVEKEVTYTVDKYENIKSMFHTPFNGFYKGIVEKKNGTVEYNYQITEHGIGTVAYGPMAHYLAYFYETPDIFKYGPIKLDGIHVKAPEGFKFTQWVDNSNNFESFDEKYKQFSNVASATISADQKDADIKWKDDGKDLHKTRVISGLMMVPEEKYWNNNNQDSTGMYQPNHVYNVESIFKYELLGEKKETPLTNTMKVCDYKLQDNRYIVSNGEPGDKDKDRFRGKTILQMVGIDETRTTGDEQPFPGELAGYGNFSRYDQNYGYTTEKYDGSDTVVTMSLEGKEKETKVETYKRIRLNSIKVEAKTSFNKEHLYEKVTDPRNAPRSEKLKEVTLEKIKYWVDGSDTPREVKPDFNNLQDGRLYIFTPKAGERVKKIEFHYSKMAYVGDSAGSIGGRLPGRYGIGISDMNYTVSKDAKPEDLYPLNYTITREEGDKYPQAGKAENFIYIHNEKCPRWGFTLEDVPAINLDTGYGDGEEYNKDGEKGILGVCVRQRFLGKVVDSHGNLIKDTGYITEIEDPIFDISIPSSSAWLMADGNITNGKIYMNEAVAKNWKNWTAKVVTITPEEYKTGNRDKNNYNLENVEFKGPEDSSCWDLYKDGRLKDRIITGVVLFYKGGKLDISGLSNKWIDGQKWEPQSNEEVSYWNINDKSKKYQGKLVDKALFKFGVNKYSMNPIDGLYYGGGAEFTDPKTGKKIKGMSDVSNVCYGTVGYKNCVDLDKKHLQKITFPNSSEFQKEFDKKIGDIYGTWINFAHERNGGSFWKGAELLIPTNVETKWEQGTLMQGQTNKVTATVTLTADAYGDAKLYSNGGETFYFEMTDQPYVKFVKNPKLKENGETKIGKAYIDDAEADAEFVTINGKNYVKIKSLGTKDKVKEKEVETVNKGVNKTYKPWKISFYVYTSPAAPTNKAFKIFEGGAQSRPKGRKDGSWLDMSPIYPLKKDGKVYTTQSMPIGGMAPSNGGWELSAGGNQFMNDDPIGIYEDTPANELHWAYKIDSFINKPNVIAQQGLSLIPGLVGEAGSKEGMLATQNVKPYQENLLRVALAITASSDVDMINLDSTIALPRKGESLVTKLDNKTLTSNVDLYLSGPLKMDAGFREKDSTTPVITYIIKNGDMKKEYTEEEVKNWTEKDWNEVTHFRVHVNKVVKGDSCQLQFPLKSGAAKDAKEYNHGTNDGHGEYKAYMEGRFTTEQMEAKNNMIDCFDFKPLELSGKVWNDIKEDGKKDKYVKVTYDAEGNRHEEEVDEPFINLKENKKVDVQILRNGEPIAKLRDTYDDGTQTKYVNIYDENGNYTLKTNQFKDLTIKVVFTNDAKDERMMCTKYDETTQNVFKNDSSFGVAQRIVPPESTISDKTPGIMDGKVAGLDCGVAYLPPLPDTGGIGETIFYVAGLLVVGMSFISTKVLLKL